MLSRVASNVYWKARYLERAENTARLINVHGNLLLDLPGNIAFGWETLIAITGGEELFYSRYQNPDEFNVIKFLLGDGDNPGSILNALAAARENLRTTRDIIPREVWEEINDLYLSTRSRLAAGISKRARYDFLKFIIRNIQQITGLIYGTMSHDMAYNFMRLGRYIERADMTTRILDVRSCNLLWKTGSGGEAILNPFENIQWMSVLKSLTAYQMYRQHMRLRVQGPDVLKFLLLDKEFPRTFAFCLGRIEDCLHGLPRNEFPLRRLARLQRQIQSADVHALDHQSLHTFLDELQIGIAQMHEHIDTIYFSGIADTEQALSA